MHIAEAIFLLVLRANWKNIVLINANDKGSEALISMLNSAGQPVITVGYRDMENYPWPERLSIKPTVNGYILLAQQLTNLSDILNFMQAKHLMSPRRPWIIGVEGSVCIEKIMRCFREGDLVLIVTQNSTSGIKCSLPGETFTKGHEDSGITRDISLWSLYSPGNGSFSFKKRDFNILIRSEQLFEKPFRNFLGRTLKISSLASPPIIKIPEKDETRWKGYIFEIINTLADVFSFKYTVKVADSRLYGAAQEDGTWSGMIGELMNKSVDIGAGDLSWTLERFMVVDLTEPVFPETVTFIYRAPEYYSRTWILFQGIQPKVWIGMMSASIAAFSAYFLSLTLHQIWRRSFRDRSTVYIQAADESLSSLYRGLLGKGVINVPFSISARTVLGVWFVSSLILGSLYGGSLTSKLSLHKSPKPADSLKELLKRHPNAVLAVKNATQAHDFFKKSVYWKDVWLKNMKSFVIPGQTTIKDTMNRVHNSSDQKQPYAWIADRSMLVKKMQEYTDDPVVCDLYVAKEDIIKSDWSIALRRDSPFLIQFNEMIERMKKFGLLEKWRRKYWESARGVCHPNDGLNESGEQAISFDDTRAIFIVLAIGWAAGIVILIIERQYCIRCD